MHDHLFLVNCHKEVDQAIRQAEILRRHFCQPASGVAVYLDGPDGHYGTKRRERLGQLATVLRGPYEPDKCQGILTALNALVAHAASRAARLVSFLHPDMLPTSRPTWQTFLRRFDGSGRPLAWAPMWPDHYGVSFIALHFRLPAARKFFPVVPAPDDRFAHRGWFNEFQLAAHLDRAVPGWDQDAYELALMTQPCTGAIKAPDGTVIGDKVMHAAGGKYVVNDYCPETSVVHTNDPSFWEHHERWIKF